MENQYQLCTGISFVVHIVTAIYPVVGDYIVENANIELLTFFLQSKCHSYYPTIS